VRVLARGVAGGLSCGEMLARRLALGLAALLGLGCARNAVLEVTVELPAGPADRFAVVQFETDATDFDTVWARTDDYAGTALGTTPQSVDFSVVSETPETRVRMKVSFCTTADCSGIDDAPDRVPAVWYELERSLYVGRRTQWTATIDTLPIDPPDVPIDVGRCEIAGCIEAPETVSHFCRLDGRHYCE
jgi:hypothetical protein